MVLTETAVSDSILVFDGSYPGGGNVTSTVVHRGDEAVVFDSLLYPEDTRKLLDRLDVLNLNIRGLVNSHWHADHTAGNQLFLGTKRILSHSLCADLMRSDDLEWLNKDLEEKDRIKPLYPNEAIENGSIFPVGGQTEVELFHTPGHTPDSIIGWLKDEKVVIAGDTVMELPFVGYGDNQSLIESLRRVQSFSRGARIIQGHGGICENEKLDGDLKYIEDMKRRTTEYFSSGKTVEEALRDIKLEDCVTKERFDFLARGYVSLLWCHPENVRKTFTELERKTG